MGKIMFVGDKILFTASDLIAFNSNCCCIPDCSICTSTPARMKVQFGGIVNNACSQCAGDLNGVDFILTQQTYSPSFVFTVNCWYEIWSPLSSACGATNYWHITCSFVTVNTVLVGLSYSPVAVPGFDTNGATFGLGMASDDCLNNLSSPTNIPRTSTGSSACTWGAATCTLTALAT